VSYSKEHADCRRLTESRSVGFPLTGAHITDHRSALFKAWLPSAVSHYGFLRPSAKLPQNFLSISF